jgi:hypothetical protein
MNEWQGKAKYLEKIRSSATLSPTHPTWLNLGSNLGHCSGKAAINRLSYGMATSRPALFAVFYQPKDWSAISSS